MTTKLGLHWLREHPDNKIDLPHIERMQYRSVKPFKPLWDNRDASANLLVVLPRDSYILARDHALSEQKEDSYRDPVGTGTRHANEWADKVRNGQYHLPVDRSFFLGINEPNADSGDRAAIDRYNVSFLNRLRQHGLRGGAFSFSTGHPRTVDGTPHTPADYSVFEASHRAIVEGHHIGVLHIYGTAAVPLAPGHYDRLRACPWQDVEWVVGECGADEHVIGGGNHDGYLTSMSDDPARYCAWLDKLILGVNDPRIHSFQPFTYDFSHPWSSFDVRVIRDALERFDWQHGKIAAVGTGPTPAPTGPTAIVSTPAGARIRSGPGTSFAALGAVVAATPLPVVGKNATGDWWKVRSEFGEGWVSATIVKAVNVNGVPIVESTPVQPADNWARSRAFIARWEGGYQNVHNDSGNWTGGAVGVGENKGTKFGISAASYPHLDIKNLTLTQADAIYFKDYWQASGASNLPWPACLIVLDTAVLHGVGTAKSWLAEVGPNPLIFAARRLAGYPKRSNWDFWGKAWVNRVADLLIEASRP